MFFNVGTTNITKIYHLLSFFFLTEKWKNKIHKIKYTNPDKWTQYIKKNK